MLFLPKLKRGGNMSIFKKMLKSLSTSKQEKQTSDRKHIDNNLIDCEHFLHHVKETNQDGINRQDILAQCKIDDSLQLTFNQFEQNHLYHNTVKNVNYRIDVYTQIGCIGSFIDYQIGHYMKNGGLIHNAKISLLKHPKTKQGKIECRITFQRNKIR